MKSLKEKIIEIIERANCERVTNDFAEQLLEMIEEEPRLRVWNKAEAEVLEEIKEMPILENVGGEKLLEILKDKIKSWQEKLK